MARINLTQAINLIVLEKIDGKPSQKTLELKRGINEVDPDVLVHPYIQAHMKAGSASIVPDPMDPEDIAAAAEEIARQARARADAARELKLAEQKKVDDAIAAADLKTDGPTVAQYVAAGYKASGYPPEGYASKSTAEEIAAAIAAETKTDAPAPVADATNAAPSATEAAPAATEGAAPAAPASDPAPAAGEPGPAA